MNKIEKADLHGIGFKSKTDDYFTDNQTAFSAYDFTDFQTVTQCRRCRMYAIRVRQFERICDQLARHIDRERLEAENG